MSNLVREMLVGRVDFGESSQARSASYSAVEDAMARSIVRLECEAEELRAEVAMLREERNILARAKAAVTEGAEPSCNDSAQAFRERPEPSPHLSDTPETDAHSPELAGELGGNIICPEAIRANNGIAWERERDLLRVQFSAAEGLGMALIKTIDELRTQKAELIAKLVNLQGRSRPATLDEISESVREKHDPEYEFGGRDE